MGRAQTKEEPMRRQVMAFALAAGTVAALLGPAVAAHAQSGGGCGLSGNAKFKPGLTNDEKQFTYSFGGSLQNCQSNVNGAPTSGKVSAGQIIKINGVRYQEPIPKGDGTCGSGTTTGVAITRWGNGSYTVISYNTQSAAAAVLLQGQVEPSVRLTSVSKPATYYTVKTKTYSGMQVLGALTFAPSDPTACSGSGVTSAAINGFVGIGSQ